MRRIKGPRQPVSINPNGNPDYTYNPMENLPVEEFAPWDYSGIDESNISDTLFEPVFPSVTGSVFLHENTPSSKLE